MWTVVTAEHVITFTLARFCGAFSLENVRMAQVNTQESLILVTEGDIIYVYIHVDLKRSFFTSR